MCDTELLIGYLYGELDGADRASFERHLAECGDCRAEVDGLRGTRGRLQSWAPPAPDLGFQIVREAAPVVAVPRRWRVSPAWGLAAAAMLIGAVSAAIANVELTVGRDGVRVRTGWTTAAQVESASADASDAAANAGAVERMSAQIRDLENRLSALASAPAAVPASAAVGSRMSDAEMIRTMRQLIDQSEERQQGVLARQILQVNRDMETARRTDFDRLRRGIQQVEGTAMETFRLQKAFEDQMLRIGMQR